MFLVCNVRRKRQSAITLTLILASLVVVVNIISTSDWKRQANKVVCTPLQMPDQTTRTLPQCIIAGVRKCGTLALMRFLNLHTDISAAPREIHFFDEDTTYMKGLEWYREQMPDKRPHQITIEKTPGYFTALKAPERVKHMNSSIRLLFIVRDPVVRMISDYKQISLHLITNDSSPLTFEEIALSGFSEGRVDVHSRVLQASVYHLHLRRWLQRFNRNQIHIVDGNALISDPASELSKVETFLGLENQLTPDMFHLNDSSGFYCTKTRCLGVNKGRKHPTVRQEVLDKLCLFFKPHNQRFFKLVGQEFSWC